MKEAIAFPELSARTDQRPPACPRCGRAGMGWHRGQRRPLVDLKLLEVEVFSTNAKAAEPTSRSHPRACSRAANTRTAPR